MKKDNYYLLILLILFIVPLFDLMHIGLPQTHDGQDHVARIASFYQGLSDGNIIPRWAGNLNWGYGHPILMFLYPLPSYFASLFHLLGFSFVDSVKLVFGFSYVLSGIAMYFWIKELYSPKAGFIAGLLYSFAPYRFVDLYVRGALGEHVAFVFPPLIFYFLTRFARNSSKKDIILASLATAGLILSHNAVSLMFLPIILCYILFLYFYMTKRKKIILMFLPIGIGFFLSAFFWLPAFFEGKYTLRDIVTNGDYLKRFVDLQSLIYGTWNYGGTGQFTTQVGIIQIVFLLLSIFFIYLLYKKSKKEFFFGIGVLIILLVSLFLITSPSLFIWKNISIIQKFQFPWRFLTVSVFCASVLSAFVVQHFQKIEKIGIVVIVGLILYFNKDYWHARDFLQKPENFYTGIYNSTTDTGESSPIWSVRFMEKSPKAHSEVISGNARINEIKRNSTIHIYQIESFTNSRILENTLYFPGWSILANGKKIEPQFQDPQFRGLMTYELPQGSYSIQIHFSDTKIRQLGNIISLVGIIILLFILTSKKWKRFQ